MHVSDYSVQAISNTTVFFTLFQNRLVLIFNFFSFQTSQNVKYFGNFVEPWPDSKEKRDQKRHTKGCEGQGKLLLVAAQDQELTHKTKRKEEVSKKKVGT